MTVPVVDGAGLEVWILRFALLLTLGLVAFLLADAWRAGIQFKQEMYDTTRDHETRLVRVETVLELEEETGG